MGLPTLPAKFEYRRAIGAGGMGAVHLAYDRERGEEVALKLLAPAPGADLEEARFLFQQEFWAMASLPHPNLVAAYDFGLAPDGTPYFTMEYVPGRDLTPGEAIAEEDVRAWLPGVAAALGYLHGQGYVHGDLKPENIRLREDGTPKLMDLGLLARAGRAGGPIRGSLAYMAPETIRQSVVDGRADLYALGALLYHLLIGRPPFDGNEPVAVLKAHLASSPAHPREARPDLSPGLAGAIARLLAKDPAARFPHAAALLDALGMRGTEAAPVGLLGSPVIGREEAHSALAELVSGDAPATLWLVGEAGSGKTRLLQEARAEAQLAGVPTLHARGLGEDAPPYQALRPLLLALVDEPSPTLARLAPVLIKLLPDPGLFPGVEPAPSLEGTQERVRLRLAVAELARSRHQSAVWLVDDWDRLDPASRDLVSFLRRQGADRPWRWVVSGAGAPEGEPATTLGPLDEASAHALASALLGQPLPPAVAERIGPLSGGQPGAIEALLEHWVRTGALRWLRGAWSAGPAHAFDVPGGLGEALDAGFAALDETARRVARAAAVLGREGELPGLAAVWEGDEDALFEALGTLERAGVLFLDRTAGEATYRFDSPARAARVLAASDEVERRPWHGRAGRWLARRLGGDPEAAGVPLAGLLEAARHLLAGDEPTQAPSWVVAAVRRAIAMYELGASALLLERALALPNLPAAVQLQLEVFTVNTIRHQGRTDEALAYYRDHDLLARLEQAQHPAFLDEFVTFGALLAIKSAYPEARAHLERAIALADGRRQAAPAVRARLFAGRVAYFAGEAEAAKAIMAEALAKARAAGLTNLLAGTLSFSGYVIAATDPAHASEGLALLDEAIALNRELGNLVETNEALGLQGNVLMAANRFAEARAAFQGALDNSSKYGIDLDEVPARLNLGAIALEQGDLAAARAEGHRAGEAAQRQGRKFMHGYALALEGAALVLSGSPAAGADMVERAVTLAREIGNRYLELNVLVFYIPVLACLGRYEEAGDALALARQIGRETHNVEFDPRFDRFETMIAVMAALASTEEPDRAQQAEIADRIARLVRRTHAQEDDVGLAHAMRWEAEWQLCRDLPKVAADTAEEALELARAHGLLGLSGELERLQARIHLALDEPREAAAAFEASLETANAAGDRHLAILNEHSLAAVTHDLARQREAADALRALGADLPEAQRELYERVPERRAVLVAEAVAAQRLEERVGAVLDLMAVLTADDGPIDLDGVLELAVRAVVKISDADRGFLLLYEGATVTREVFYGMSAAESDVYSRNFADQVYFGQEAVIMEDVQSDFHLGHQQSVQTLGLRGVVGVPLVAGDLAIGAIIADCRRVNASFGEDQRDLVLALARQVAHAIVLARRHEERRRSLARLEAAHRLAIATAGRWTTEDFMAPVARTALALAGARRAYLLAGSPLACLGAFGTDGLGLPASVDGPALSTCQEAFEQREARRATAGEPCYALPLVCDGQCLGVLSLEGRGPSQPDDDLDGLLAGIGDLVGAWLANRAPVTG